MIGAYLIGLGMGIMIGYDIAKGRGIIGRWWNR